jgi:hypothetical protein
MVGLGFKDVKGKEVQNDSILKFTFTDGTGHKMVVIGHVKSGEPLEDQGDFGIEIWKLSTKKKLWNFS